MRRPLRPQPFLPLTSLVGREREIAAVADLLRTGVRLLTLTGPGGTGKTRLGLEVAAAVGSEYADGVRLVSLAPLAPRSPAGVIAAAIAQSLGLIDSGGGSIVEWLKAFLGRKHLLLALDNFEHVLDAAPVVIEVLQACPSVQCLVTSRTPLRISGEQEFAVPPLPLPSLGADDLSPLLGAVAPATAATLVQNEAVRLFCDRARAVQPDFAVTEENAAAVAAICRRLDGLPLAIELAAARIRLLAPWQMRDRLERRLPLLTGGARDLPARQQTMRDTIAWSYDLLSAAEQTLLARLAIFVGGWTLDAAEAVCRGSAAGADVLRELESLVAISLAQRVAQQPASSDVRPADGAFPTCEADPAGPPRFVLLETVREFALEQLAASGELPQLRRRHAVHFTTLCESAAPAFAGVGDHGDWMARLEQEQLWAGRLRLERDNLRAALTWAEEQVESDDGENGESGQLGDGRVFAGQLGLRLLAALADAPPVLGAWREYVDRAERVLYATRAHPPTRAREIVLTSLVHTLMNGGDLARMRAAAEEWVAVDRALADQPRPATVSLPTWGSPIAWLVLAMHRTGDHAPARRLLADGVAGARALGRSAAAAWQLIALAWGMHFFGDVAQAQALLAEADEIAGATGNRWVAAKLAEIRGLLAHFAGDQGAARAHSEDAVARYRALGLPWLAAMTLRRLAEICLAAGDAAAARKQCEEALRIYRAAHREGETAQTLARLAQAALAGGDVMGATQSAAESVAIVARVRDPDAVAAVLLAAAEVTVALEQPIPAVRLFSARLSMVPRDLYGRLRPADQIAFDAGVAAARARLSPDEFATAWAAGDAMSTEAALAGALTFLQLRDGPADRAPAALAQPPRTRPDHRLSPLTARQHEVAALVTEGLTNRQIGERLVISERTVENHVERILIKLDFHSRAQIAAWVGAARAATAVPT